MATINVPNRFYDKNITKAMELYKNHLQHTARLYEIRNQNCTLRRSSSSHCSQLSSRSTTSFDDHRQLINGLHQASKSRLRASQRSVNQRNEQLYNRLQSIHNKKNKYAAVRVMPGGCSYQNDVGSMHYQKKKVDAKKLDQDNFKFAARIMTTKPSVEPTEKLVLQHLRRPVPQSFVET